MARLPHPGWVQTHSHLLFLHLGPLSSQVFPTGPLRALLEASWALGLGSRQPETTAKLFHPGQTASRIDQIYFAQGENNLWCLRVTSQLPAGVMLYSLVGRDWLQLPFSGGLEVRFNLSTPGIREEWVWQLSTLDIAAKPWARPSAVC